jgi:hypothetical protein
VDTRLLCSELAALGVEMEKAQRISDWDRFWRQETLLDQRLQQLPPATAFVLADERQQLRETLREILRITDKANGRLTSHRDDIHILIDALGGGSP